jgi:hypothetical protein
MKSYLEKNNLHYFIFSKNSEKPIKEAIHHLPPDTPVEDISSSLDDLGFNVTNMRQMSHSKSTQQPNPHGNSPSILCYLNKKQKSHEIFKLNNLNHVIIKVELYRAQTSLMQLWPPAQGMP